MQERGGWWILRLDKSWLGWKKSIGWLCTGKRTETRQSIGKRLEGKKNNNNSNSNNSNDNNNNNNNNSLSRKKECLYMLANQLQIGKSNECSVDPSAVSNIVITIINVLVAGRCKANLDHHG